MLRLSKPLITEAAIERVAAVLRSGQLVQGESVGAFEAALAQYLGVRHAIAVSSATAALHLGLIALDIGPGDEVIVPAFTFPATANVVERVGATSVVVDVRADDLCLDVTAAARRITPKTRAIIPVHEFGQAAPIEALCALAREHGVAVIEDAACAFGSTSGDRKVGGFGAIGCFSFHPRKAITTGEGGLVVCADDRIAGVVRALRNHGMVPSATGGRAEFRHAGLNYRMTDFQGALGLAQLSDFDHDLAARQVLAQRYDELLSVAPEVIRPARTPRRGHSFQTYHVVLPARIDRDAVIAALRERGVETNLGAQALNCLPYFQERYGLSEGDCPNATVAYLRGLALPMGRHVTIADVERVAAELVSIVMAPHSP